VTAISESIGNDVKVTSCGIDITGTIPEFELWDGGELHSTISRL
jgi:hypothetical protein